MQNFKELSFIEYYKSKRQLLEALDESPRVYSTYKVKKYCKVPVFESYDSDEKIYIALKPHDKIQVLWEYENLHYPTAKSFVILENNREVYYPAWNNKKLLKWTISNAEELKDNSIIE